MQGAYDYLVKPFDIGRVRALVDAAFKQHALTRSSVRLGGQEGEDEPASDQMVGKSAAVLEVYKKIGQVADPDFPCLITEALRRNRGNVSAAARLLGISRLTLRKKSDEYGIRAED